MSSEVGYSPQWRFFRAGIDSNSLASLNAPPSVCPQTYIVAQNPEVLAHLMKENENRGLSPAAYTAPASVFNTVAVDFEKKDDEPVLKTCPMPVQTFHKLDPEVSDTVSPENKQKLERTPSRTSTGSATPKLGSLERVHSSHGSLEKSGMFSPKLGSLERKSRNGSPKMSSKLHSPKMGSLERNSHVSPHLQSQSLSLPYDPDLIPDFHPEPTVYQFAPDKTKEMQQYGLQECIYDFGGADVKSCAHKQQYFVQKSDNVSDKVQVGIKHGLISNLCSFAKLLL